MKPMWIAAGLAGIAAAVIAWSVRGGSVWRLEVVDLGEGEGGSLSPDGSQITWTSDRRIFVGKVDGTGERVDLGDASGEPRWMRDGTFVLASRKGELQKLPVAGGAPVSLGVIGTAPDDCGGGLVFVRHASDGDRLLYKATGKPERELVRGYADERLDQPRCDPSGTRIVFLRDSDVYLSDLAGAITPLTTTHDAGGATWSHDGASVIVASRGLAEMPAAGGSANTFYDGPASSPDVSRDGQTLLFAREVEQFSILGGEGSGKPRTVSSGRQTAIHLRVASPKGEVLLAERAGDVLVIDTISGVDRVLTPGRRPFPSLDGKLVYFRAVDDPKQVMVIPLAGGTATKVATLPGRIVVGTDGPDGQHVMIDEDEHHLVSYRIGERTADGTPELTDEGAHWVVPAPSGGWRYWQKPGTSLELRVIAPGKALGSMDCVFEVDSLFNAWLDDHRLAYLRAIEVEIGGKTERHDAWHILDVRTCTDEKPLVTVIDVGDHGGRDAVMAPDGVHWFRANSVSRVSRVVARNFASRPR